MKVGKKYFLALPIVLTILILATFLLPKGSQSEKVSFPMEIGEVKALKYATGEEAIKMVMSIHWNPKALKGIEDAAVVLYSDGSRLWVTVFKSEDQALKLLNEMVSKISQYEAELPYGTPIPHAFEGVKVYFIPDKRGGMHALWASGKYLIWLELGQDGINVLKALIKYYSSG